MTAPPRPDYSEIVQIIKEAPVTYLPALVIEIVEESVRKKIWAPGGLIRTINNVLDRTKEQGDANAT